VLLTALGGVVAVAQAQPGTITYTLSGTPGQNGWWVSPVVVHWSVTGSPQSSSGCEAALLISDDTPGTTRTCSVTWTDSSITKTTTETIRIDQTPPVATAATPARPPDAGGWFNHPVTITWSGTDNFTAQPPCTSTTYAGPDDPAASLTGTCRDAAGNVSAPLAFGLAYDATPPTLTRLAGQAGDRTATLTWQASPDAASITVTRAPAGAVASVVYRGGGDRFRDRGLRNGIAYHYVVVAADAAGNAAQRDVDVVPGRLTAPAPGARLTAPPLLRWVVVARARYYNVQLFRGSHKVLSAWPTRAKLQLTRAWHFGGRRQRLRPGTYRWFVWPGYGTRAAQRYGRLLGHRTFTIV
jgi:hypothetical protein